MKRVVFRLSAVAVLLVLQSRDVSAAPMGTAFTYQGQLKEGGLPVNATCDLDFSLWDDPVATNAGNLLGDVTVSGVEVVNGLFTVDLDFGGGQFDGDARWLEVTVCCIWPDDPAGLCSSPPTNFSTLEPRQRLTPTPYALRAETSGDGSPWEVNGTAIYYNAGNVGVGTSSPLASLQVGDLGNWSWAQGDGWGDFSLNNGVVGFSIGVATAGGGTGDVRMWPTGGTERLIIGNPTDGDILSVRSGNVGIRTLSPTHTLTVAGSHDVFRAGGANSWFEVSAGGNTRLSLGDGAGNEAGIILGRENAAGENVVQILGCDDAGNCPAATSFHENGRVGIGTDDPARELEVVGDVYLDGSDDVLLGDVGTYGHGMRVTGTRTGPPPFPILTSHRGNVSYDGDALRLLAATSGVFLPTEIPETAGITIRNGGRVGVGTPDPSAAMEIASNSTTTNPQLLLTENEQDFSRLTFSNTENARFWSVAGSTRDAGDGSASDDLNFYHSVAGNVINISYDGSAKVGIGTTAPQVRLHVRGGTDTSPARGGYLVLGSTAGTNISIDNNEIMARNNGQPATLFLNNEGGLVRVPVLEITGADVAERFPVTDEIKPGMVAEIDPDASGQLRLARGAYNRRVAGVVSGANGLSVGAVLGNLPGSENAPPIALSGRVWVHCDATAAGIEPGDLLTTSDTPGHAMKVVDHARAQGAILGKAMTRLDEGKGLVLVLVSLQ
ncbi:MAG: hypothetical protein ACE5HE_07330 [Phycisphaerae bacterium]